ncbi:lipid kinase, YegS/Rv2252/BmrU family [Acetitomaculum ruminis DSM 5522]|uniref:Lipid kinase, YegS/Rv2252/BmrU family n=1 Tax=Acetitomaculum ruminis DSM 5522 TaxID=1120918 RepID=A0A1I0XAQ0_9FIRM|nr:diacylglycerol kinase family protein [Acetitomaculum ruminis]SFA98112.1 lipid kinase, YegS/Rv2252/BmrU family [Acetitomaculum ruminis DSM 5522]
MKKLLLIYNPHAGKALIKNKLSEIVEFITKSGFEITIYSTLYSGHAKEIVKARAGEFDIVVCSGGDGTLDEVVTGIMEKELDTVVGYIPAGSTNDFANSLRLPKTMVNAAKLIENGSVVSCDVGQFNEDSFVYIAAFGLFTDVSYQTSQELKNVLGHAAYLLEGVKRLANIMAYDLKVYHDDEVIEGRFIYGMITNSLSVGGFQGMTGRNVKLDDGLFEVMLIREPKNPIELQNIITSLLLAEEADSRYILSFKTDNLRIEAKDNISWTLDGEFGGDYKDVDIKVRKRALKILVKK